MTEELKHPRALAIAKKGENCLWEMGDYLIEIAGKPRDDGLNDGSRLKIADVSEELTGKGYPQYDLRYLGKLRWVAHTFPAGRRTTSLSWSTHEEAKTPDILDEVIIAAKAEGLKGVPSSFVRKVIRSIDADERADRTAKQTKAEREAHEAETEAEEAEKESKRANSTKAREAADEKKRKAKEKAAEKKAEARKLRGAPTRGKGSKGKKLTAPKSEEVPLNIAKLEFSVAISELARSVRTMDKKISPHIDELSKAFIVGSVEELLEVANAVRKLADKVQRNQTNKRAHLHAVA